VLAQALAQQLAVNRRAAVDEGVFGEGPEAFGLLCDTPTRTERRVPEGRTAHRQVEAMVGLDSAHLERGGAGSREDEAGAAQRVGAGFEFTALDERPHGALRHQFAEPRALPAGSCQVHAAQVSVLGNRAEHAVSVHRRAFARRGLPGLGRGSAQQAVEQVGSHSHGAQLASGRCHL